MAAAAALQVRPQQARPCGFTADSSFSRVLPPLAACLAAPSLPRVFRVRVSVRIFSFSRVLPPLIPTPLSPGELRLPQRFRPGPAGPRSIPRARARRGSHVPHGSRLQARHVRPGPSVPTPDSSSVPRGAPGQRKDRRVRLEPRIHCHHCRASSPQAHPPEPAPHAVDRVGPGCVRVCARVVHVGDTRGDEVENRRTPQLKMPPAAHNAGISTVYTSCVRPQRERHIPSYIRHFGQA